VQEVAAFEIARLSQVEVQETFDGLGLEAEPALFVGEVPTMRLRRMRARGASSPWQRIVWTASLSSARPGTERPRKAARVSARRTASMAWADEASRPCSRRSRATRTIQWEARWPAEPAWGCSQRKS
jgi:hypothetical protein